MHFVFANNPEPALSATHPAPFAPGDAPKGWKNIPKDKPVHATHTENRGIVIETPEEYIEQTIKPNGGK